MRSQDSTGRLWFKVSRFCYTLMKYSCDRRPEGMLKPEGRTSPLARRRINKGGKPFWREALLAGRPGRAGHKGDARREARSRFGDWDGPRYTFFV